MNLQNQSEPRDCFRACIINALHCLDIPVDPAVLKRLEAFAAGTENCTIYGSEESIERYGRSIHKFIAEWNWACRNKNDGEEWASCLINRGIELSFRNGPVEQKKVITGALAVGCPVICETRVASKEVRDSECRHFVLLIKAVNDTLLVHDPQPAHWNNSVDAQKVRYCTNDFGSNVEIDFDYFFNGEPGYMKPKPNPHQMDTGYKFIVVSGVNDH